MPQEKPKTEPVLNTGGESRNKKLWQLYGKARKLQREGMSYQEVSKMIADYTKNEIPGMASLENALGADKPREGVAETLRANVATALEGTTGAHVGEIGGIMSGVKAAAGAMLPGGETPQEAFSPAYLGRREQIESMIRSHQEEHPGVAALTEMTGAALPMVATGGVSAGGSIGSVAQRGLAGAGRGAVMGGAGGAAYGHGAAEPGSRKRGMLIGGLLGTGVGFSAGGALPFIGAGARKLGLGLLDEMGGAGRKLAQSLRDKGSARQIANTEMRAAVREAETTPQAIAAKMRGSPSDEMIMNMDPSLARQARAARNTYAGLDRERGPVQRVMARFLETGDRVASRLRKGTRIARTPESSRAVTEAAEELWRAEHLAPLREANPIFGDMRLRKTLKDNEEILDFLRHSKFFDGEDFNETGRISYKAADDTIKRMRASWRGGNHADDDLKAAFEVFEEIVGDRVEGYSAAKDVWRMIQARSRGYDSGMKLVNRSEAEIREAYRVAAKEGPEAVGALREGWMDALEKTLRNDESGGAIARKLERGSGDPSTGLISRLKILFDGDDAAYGRFVEEAASDNRWAVSTRALTGNSTTPQQIADQLGGYITTKRAAMNEFLSVVFEDKEIRRRASKQIGELLMSGDDAAVEEFLVRMLREKSSMQMLGKQGMTALGMVPGILSSDEAQSRQPVPTGVMGIQERGIPVPDTTGLLNTMLKRN